MASTSAQVTLTDAKTGAGASIDLLDARRNVSAVLVASGTVTDGQVAVEASQDGVSWVTRHLFEIPAASTVQSYDSTTGAYRYWRASVARPVTGGGTVKVTLMEGDR